MKAIILAAGYATRLYPLTLNKPKPLLGVAGKPIIEHILFKIEEIDEIDDIFIVTNDKFHNAFLEWKESYNSAKKIKIINDKTTSEKNRLGAIGDIDFAIKAEDIDDDVLVIGGDNLFEFSLKHLISFFEEKAASVIALYDVKEKELAAGKYGVVETNEDSKIIGFEEKPGKPKTTLVSTACYIFSKEDVEELERCIAEHHQPDNLGDFVKWLAGKKHVYGFAFSEKWFDIGDHHQLKKADSEWGKAPRTLVTGGAGFIGSHLCEFLLSKGHEVICMDNFVTGASKNIDHLKRNPKFSAISHDVTKQITIEGKLDYILHFASPASPIDYQKIPIQTLKVGSLGTHNALGLAKEKKAVFLLASTSEIYGDPLVNPQPESYWGNVNPIGVRGCYDEAKRFSEAITMAYHRVHKLDTRIVRIFNTYGPRMRVNDGRVVPAFITQALNDEPLTVFGDGKQTRSFCYVSDLVEGIYLLLMSNIHDPVNIGNPAEITILEFGKEVIKAAKSKSEIIFKPLPTDDPKVRRPDITKAKKTLGWAPKVNLQDGLNKAVGYFRENK